MPAQSLRRDAFAAMIQDDRALVAHDGTLVEIALQRVRGLARKRNLALLAALAAQAQPAFGAVDIVEIEPDQLADAHPAAVEQLEDGAVARRDADAPACPDATPSSSVLTCSAEGTSGSRFGALGVRTSRAVLSGITPSRIM